MKKSTNTGKDIMLTLVTKFIFLGGSFIVSIILARLLGTEGKGIVTTLFVFPNLMISLADLGVRQASTYYIGRKIYKLEDIAASNLLLWILTSIASILVVLVYFYSPISSESYSTILIIIALIYIPVKILIAYFNGILQGEQLISNINMKFIIEFVSRLAIVILLVWTIDLGVVGASLATLLSAVFVLFYSLSIVSQTTKLRVYYKNGIPQSLIKKGFLFALCLFILQLNYKVDIMFLESMVSPSEVGIYSVGVTLAELIWQVPAAISTVLFARSANSKSDLEASERTAKLLRICWIPLIAVSIIFWILSPFFVRILYGSEFIEAGTVIRLLLPGILMMVLHKVLYADISGKGKPLLILNVYIVSLLINVGLNFVFIPQYGINGAAVSSSISYVISAVALSIKYHKFSGLKYTDLFILKREDIDMLRKRFHI